jgi:hypothetical protein
MKYYFDRSAKTLPELTRDQPVLVRQDREWIKGKVLHAHPKPRSYIVETESNVLRRNRKDLRSTLIPPVPYNPDPFDILSTSSSNEVVPEIPDTTIPTNISTPKVVRPQRTRMLPSRFKDYVM